MAFKDETLDLFELSDKMLATINEKGKVELGTFDISFKFSKDSNKLDNILNFYIYVFEEEFGKTMYSKKYNTVEKMMKLMRKNMKDEYMFKDIREGLILTKIKNLKNHLYETIKAIKVSIAELNEGSERGVIVDIEEQRNNKKKEKNGMPFFVLTAVCRPKKIDIKIPLESNASDWEKDTILKALKEQLG